MKHILRYKSFFSLLVISVLFLIGNRAFADFKTDFFEGKTAFDNKRYTAASHLFRKALQQNPNSDVSRYYLAITYAYLQDYEKARENYQILVTKGTNPKIKKLAGEGLIYLPQKRAAASKLKPVMNTAISKNNYKPLTFSTIKEYKYNWQLRNPPPPHIKALENNQFVVKGYMIPIEGGEYFQTFLLVNLVPDCFFCNPPPANQVLYVNLKNGKVNYIKNKLINVYGKLKIGQIDDPYIACVYTLEADLVEEAK
jgi:hypothetical protein